MFKKTGVANGPGLAKGPGLANGAGVASPRDTQDPVAEPNLPRQRAVEAVAGGGEAVEEGGEERRGGDEAVVEEDDGAGMEAAHDAVSHAGFPVWAVAMHCVKAPYAPADSLET